MTPARIRFAAALTWAGLVVSVLVAPGGPGRLAVPKVQPNAFAAPVRPTRPLAKPEAQTRSPAKAPVAVGEPSGTPHFERYTPTQAPASWLQATHPDQFYAGRSSVRGGNHWALIIGINEYASPTRDNVGSYQDAVSLRSYLLRLGWRSDHVLLLGNGEATRNHVIQGVQWLASKTDHSSTVVFHYSGHEIPYHSDVDGDGESMDVALWLADNSTLVDGDLGRLLGHVRAAKMWLNFAVCRAGGFNDPGTISSGRLITYSSPESELSYEDPSVSHSVFGYYSIVEGMQSGDADADGDGVTTVQEAFSYARPRVVDRTGDKQHPTEVDRYGSPFSLVAPIPPAPPKPRPSPAPSASQTPCTLPVGCRR